MLLLGGFPSVLQRTATVDRCEQQQRAPSSVRLAIQASESGSFALPSSQGNSSLPGSLDQWLVPRAHQHSQAGSGLWVQLVGSSESSTVTASAVKRLYHVLLLQQQLVALCREARTLGSATRCQSQAVFFGSPTPGIGS